MAERFMMLNSFLETLKGDIYSVMDIDFSVDVMTPVNLLNNEKFEARYKPIYLNSKYGKEIYHIEGIFLHTSGFYIYLSRFDGEVSFNIKVIYKVEQYEEIKIYINSLKKLK
jgi:hypothetical protein